ncbi:unnamed protein product [Pedinophyceae sp. YPF-701]|nr:unnamed protein product [Pedinophyceae sp. YPF-701]
MASKFWGGGSSSEEESQYSESESGWSESGSGSSSSSESSSSASSSSSSSSSEGGAARFLAGSDSDTDSEDGWGGKRTVKSKRTKGLEAVQQARDEITNAAAAGDWAAVSGSFDRLLQLAERAQAPSALGVVPAPPRAFIAALVELDAEVSGALADEDARKSMNRPQAKALNVMKQRIRKAMGVEPWQELIRKCKEDPENFEAEGDEAEGAEGEGAAGVEEEEVQKEDPIFSMELKDITFQMVNERLQAARMARGKKGTSKQDQLRMLLLLLKATASKDVRSQQAAVLLHLISLLFDFTHSAAAHIPVPLWKRAVYYTVALLDLLEANPLVVLDELSEAYEERTEPPPGDQPVKVPGNLVGFVERLDDELFKCLQVTDPHTNAYLARMKDEAVLLALAQRVSAYLAKTGNTAGLARVALRRVEHYYYKTEAVFEALRRASQEPLEVTVADGETRLDFSMAEEGEEGAQASLELQFEGNETLQDLVRSLSQTIYQHGDERGKARALLCNVYAGSLRGDFYGARDLLLMSHLQGNVQHMDISTQILYNRTMAMLGICAFKEGLVQDAYHCIAELYGSGRMKELLAQGLIMSKTADRTPEQEALERRRQMPFHMHINLELLETVHLSCCVLLDVPALVRTGRTSMQSKQFLRLVENQSKASFIGPPETVRDHVMAATRAMLQGDWRKAFNYLTALRSWQLLPDSKRVMAMLEAELKRAALRVHLLKYAQTYASISLSHLEEMFDLPSKAVLSTVSDMIIRDDLPASLDQPSGTLQLHTVTTPPLHRAVHALLDKATILVDYNERAASFRAGGLQDNDEDGRPIDLGEGRRRSRARGQFARMSQFAQGGRGERRNEFRPKGRRNDRQGANYLALGSYAGGGGGRGRGLRHERGLGGGERGLGGMVGI